MIRSIRDWRIHGAFAETDIAGVMPRNGLHHLAGQKGDDSDAVIADLAVAAASDSVTCGLSAPDKNGARASLSEWFGHPVGKACGVATITSPECAEAHDRAVQANALARAVGRSLPVAVLGTHHVANSHGRLNELAAWFEAEHGVGVGLVIIDAVLTKGELLSFQRQGRAVLSVCAEAPADAAGVVLEVGDGRLTVAKPAQGEPLAWEFDLAKVCIDGVESLVLKPGKAVPATPIWQAAPPVVIAPIAKKPEPQIVSRVAVLRTRGELLPEMRAKWMEDGFDKVVVNPDDALPNRGEIGDGERRLIHVDGVDQDHADLLRVANQLRGKAIERGVGKDVVILPAA